MFMLPYNVEAIYNSGICKNLWIKVQVWAYKH